MNQQFSRKETPTATGRVRAFTAKAVLAAAFAWAVLFTPGCHKSTAPENSGPGASATSPSAPGLPAHPDRDHDASLILIYTTGVSGEVTDCGCPHHPRGGLARRAHYAMGLEEAQHDVVQVDGGDSFFQFQGPYRRPDESMKKKAQAIALAAAHMKMDAINVGRTDLSAGYAFLKDELGNGAGHDPLPLLSANLVRPGTQQPVFTPYRIVDAGGAKVGIFGLFDESLTGDTALVALDPVDTAKKMIAELRPRCDVVIGLYAAPFTEAGRIAQAAPGADIIVVGEPRATLRTSPMVIGDSILAQAGNRGMYLGRMDITLRPTPQSSMSEQDQAKIKADITRLNAQRSLLEGQIQKDPSVRQLYAETTRQINELSQKLVAAGAKLDYNNSLVSMDIALPEDPVVAKYVLDAGVTPRTPAPPPAPAP